MKTSDLVVYVTGAMAAFLLVALAFVPEIENPEIVALIIGLIFGSWGTIVAYYFRGKG